MVDQLSQRSKVEVNKTPESLQVDVSEASYEQLEGAAAEMAERPKLEAVQTKDSREEKQHLQALRQGPLAATPVPTGPLPPKDLEAIKRILFPKIDFTKESPTPEQLVMALLLEHNMRPELAHDWVEFLAQTGHEQATGTSQG